MHRDARPERVSWISGPCFTARSGDTAFRQDVSRNYRLIPCSWGAMVDLFVTTAFNIWVEDEFDTVKNRLRTKLPKAVCRTRGKWPADSRYLVNSYRVRLS